MRNDTAKKLFDAGYRARYGSDGYDHVIPNCLFKRGARAVCGHTASRLDCGQEKPICPECMKQILVQKDGKWFIKHGLSFENKPSV